MTIAIDLWHLWLFDLFDMTPEFIQIYLLKVYKSINLIFVIIFAQFFVSFSSWNE